MSLQSNYIFLALSIWRDLISATVQNDLLLQRRLVEILERDDIYEAAYWAIPTIVTGGVAGAVGTKSMALGATLKSPTLIRAGMFLKPTLSGGKAVAVSKIGGGIGTTVVKPATGFFGRQKLVQGINMVKSGAKTTLISDLPLAAFSNLQEDGRGMIQEDGFFQTLFEQYPESAMFAPQIAQGINSPLFKQLDFIATETAYGTLGVVGIGGLGQSIFTQGAKKLGKLPEVPGQITRWGQKNMDQFAVSTKSWSTKIDSEFVNQKYWFEKQQEQLSDIAEAGREQVNKLADGFKNAFTEENMSDGALKSAYGAYKNGSKMMGQGLTKARDGLTQVIAVLSSIPNLLAYFLFVSIAICFSLVSLSLMFTRKQFVCMLSIIPVRLTPSSLSSCVLLFHIFLR